MAMLANLAPEKVSEAIELIPSLKVSHWTLSLLKGPPKCAGSGGCATA